MVNVVILLSKFLSSDRNVHIYTTYALYFITIPITRKFPRSQTGMHKHNTSWRTMRNREERGGMEKGERIFSIAYYDFIIRSPASHVSKMFILKCNIAIYRYVCSGMEYENLLVRAIDGAMVNIWLLSPSIKMDRNWKNMNKIIVAIDGKRRRRIMCTSIAIEKVAKIWMLWRKIDT